MKYLSLPSSGRQSTSVRVSCSARQQAPSLAGSAQLTSFLAVASCGLLPRTTRPGPRLWTAFWSVASLPLRDTRESWTWSAPLTECSVILSEASLRAKSKDPHLVASSAWVADPSQAQDDIQPVEDPKRTGRCT